MLPGELTQIKPSGLKFKLISGRFKPKNCESASNPASACRAVVEALRRRLEGYGRLQKPTEGPPGGGLEVKPEPCNLHPETLVLPAIASYSPGTLRLVIPSSALEKILFDGNGDWFYVVPCKGGVFFGCPKNNGCGARRCHGHTRTF